MTAPLDGFKEFLGEVTCSSEEDVRTHVVGFKNIS
jgi:hypothetical protein